MSIRIDYQNTSAFLSEREIADTAPEVRRMHDALESGSGAGNDFLGWLHLPSRTPESLLAEIEDTAGQIRNLGRAFVCIGIGGSYLGARAALEFTQHTFQNQRPENPEIYFSGQNIGSDHIADLLDLLEDKDYCLNVISKSGTTTEPAIAFRILKNAIEKKYGIVGAKKRIVVTTDQRKGALKKLADAQGYKTFVIPDDVGGRYSVLTPVGLLPMAVGGIDIRAVMDGARSMESTTSANADIAANPAYLYAVLRHLLYGKGKVLEVMASFHHAPASLMEWWKQLAGESEGKNGKGIFPASLQYTTDLHSLGQWVQEGNRILFETFLLMESSRRSVTVPRFENDDDGLNFLAGKSLDFVNDKAYRGTAQAHLEGGVPNLAIVVKDRSASSLGRLFYFFMRAIALSGYLLRVNPFDQPGVEFYKKNMFILLNKPGYEKGK
jgi:glucose-6-phosphate isomerase